MGAAGRVFFSMELRSLVDLAAGECGRVQRIAAGANATKRLYEMGFNTGAQVRVMKNDFGPLIVALEGNKIALGRGLAEKMLVKKLERL
jgi:ferrous iron transport protein A